MGAKWTGGCMCGAVRYECSGEQPAFTTNCYCRDCQRASGTALTSNLVFPAEAVRITRGQLQYHEHTADSGNKVRRGFCAECGCPIWSSSAAFPMVAIRAASLDDPSAFTPAMNV